MSGNGIYLQVMAILGKIVMTWESRPCPREEVETTEPSQVVEQRMECCSHGCHSRGARNRSFSWRPHSDLIDSQRYSMFTGPVRNQLIMKTVLQTPRSLRSKDDRYKRARMRGSGVSPRVKHFVVASK